MRANAKPPRSVWVQIPLVIAIIFSIPGIIFLSIILLHPFWVEHQQKSFVAHWSNLFHSHHEWNSLIDFPLKEDPKDLYRYRFKDGTWLIGSIASTDDGSGDFNAAVIVNQDGQIYWTDYGFSGYEGFDEYFHRVNPDSFNDFLERSQARWIEIKN